MMNKVSLTVTKNIQSPTTPVVELEYTANIKAKNFGKYGVYDCEDDDVKLLIGILENYASRQIFKRLKIE